MTQPPLTALERELLGFVEQLTKSSEHSAKAMIDLENRSTIQTNEALELLTDCVGSLCQSQKLSLDVLNMWVNESANYEQVKESLVKSLKQLQNAEARLKQSSR